MVEPGLLDIALLIAELPGRNLEDGALTYPDGAETQLGWGVELQKTVFGEAQIEDEAEARVAHFLENLHEVLEVLVEKPQILL